MHSRPKVPYPSRDVARKDCSVAEHRAHVRNLGDILPSVISHCVTLAAVAVRPARAAVRSVNHTVCANCATSPPSPQHEHCPPKNQKRVHAVNYVANAPQKAKHGSRTQPTSECPAACSRASMVVHLHMRTGDFVQHCKAPAEPFADR